MDGDKDRELLKSQKKKILGDKESHHREQDKEKEKQGKEL